MFIEPVETIDYLNSCFKLSSKSKSGLVWKKRPPEHFKSYNGYRQFCSKFVDIDVGTISMYKDGHTYWRTIIKPLHLLIHRVIYEMHNSIILNSNQLIDHADGNGLNNSITNIRLATRSQNNSNIKIRKDNCSGFKGIFPNGNNWSAKIQILGKRIYLGTYKTPEEAYLAYCEGSQKYHKEFGRLA